MLCNKSLSVNRCFRLLDYRKPGILSIGTISQHFLERSNVNVIDEMVKIIVGQRAYEINSKAIQTADAMMLMVNNLKR